MGTGLTSEQAIAMVIAQVDSREAEQHAREFALLLNGFDLRASQDEFDQLLHDAAMRECQT